MSKPVDNIRDNRFTVISDRIIILNVKLLINNLVHGKILRPLKKNFYTEEVASKVFNFFMSLLIFSCTTFA